MYAKLLELLLATLQFCTMNAFLTRVPALHYVSQAKNYVYK